MISLKYEAPSSLGDAIALLARASGTSRVLAGGTDVIVQMETDLIEPDLVVDIKKIPELREIAMENGGFRVGAAVTGMELTHHQAFCNAWPGVVDGVKLIGSMQIKGRATMGGNLCNASPAADSVPALIAAGAIARVAGPDGTRDVPVEGIAIGPGKTSLRKGEIVVSFLLPPRPPHSGDAYLRMTPRTEMDIAVVGVGVNVTLDADGVCTAARVSLGAEYLCEPQQTLLDILRDELMLTGTKEGCGTGDCGACTVMVDGTMICSCLMLAVEADGRKVETIEGMAKGEELHPLQRSFLELNGSQCGICTPGILIAAKALLDRNPDPTETEVRYWLAGNLCRCTGYDKIIRSVLAAAREMRGA